MPNFSKQDWDEIENAIPAAANALAKQKTKQEYRNRLDQMLATRLRDYDYVTNSQRRMLIIDSMDALDAIDKELEQRYTNEDQSN